MKFSSTSHEDKTPRVSVFTLVLFLLFLCSAAVANQSVTVAWNASPDSSVAGYYVYYGTTNGTYTSKIDVGTMMMTTIGDLQEGKSYRFAVSAYSADRVESELSDPISFTAPGVLNLVRGNNPSDPLKITFPAAAGHSYSIQATQDLQNWTTVFETIASANNVVEYTDQDSLTYPRRFYRLVLN